MLTTEFLEANDSPEKAKFVQQRCCCAPIGQHQAICVFKDSTETLFQKDFQTTGTTVRKVGGGRPKTTTARDDRYIIMQVKRGRRQSASVFAQQLPAATG
ncbi:hypothetical protein TNCV_932171 [Trichonephila clavipes]|nr:hypothetical protein TNCV_932171 [Trichonephila clavipes]